MKFEELIYCAILTIGVVLPCVQSENQSTKQDVSFFEKETEKSRENRITKREAAIVVIDNFPREIMMNKPNTHYKRNKYHNPKPWKGKHTKSNTRKPQKKYKVKKVKHGFSASAGKKRVPWKSESKYIQQQTKRQQPRMPQSSQHTMIKYHKNKKRKPYVIKGMAIEPIGFAEPPADYRQPPQSQHEPPEDSYSATFNIVHDLDETADSSLHHDLQEDLTGPEVDWNDQRQPGNFAAYSKPNLFDPDPSVEEANKYIEYNYNNLPDFLSKTNKKGVYQGDMKRLINRPWIFKKPSTEAEEIFLVGGQYAEPPARVIPFIQRQLSDKKSFFYDATKLADYIFQDGEYSATVSPYVNYKNSNMAFSPQNLNDAFSIDR